MTQDNLIKLSQPGAFSDLLTDVLRNGARALLAQAVEAEVTRLHRPHDRARLCRQGIPRPRCAKPTPHIHLRTEARRVRRHQA